MARKGHPLSLDGGLSSGAEGESPLIITRSWPMSRRTGRVPGGERSNVLHVSRLLVRDQGTRTLLFVHDAREAPIKVEATAWSLWIEIVASGRPLVDAPMARLEIVNDEAIQFVGTARLRGERDLRLVRITLELPAK